MYKNRLDNVRGYGYGTNLNTFLLTPIVYYISKWFGNSAMAGCHY